MRIFQGRILRQQLTEEQAHQLVSDFRRYKQDGLLPETFGRDVVYDHPNTLPLLKAERLRHMHLTSASEAWSDGIPQYRRTSDTHLVYCQGAMDESAWCLIAILAPEAHEQAFDRGTMLKLARIAENFRNKY